VIPEPFKADPQDVARDRLSEFICNTFITHIPSH
jgi:hypothetical protein